MRNAYAEVARTYWRRITTSWIAATLVAAGGVTMVISIAMPAKKPGIALANVIVGTLYVVGLLWAHFREQLVASRRRLCPNYTRPHLVLFVVCLALILFGWPLLIAARHRGSNPLDFMAASAACAAIVGWYVLTSSPWFVLAFMFVVMGTINASRIDRFNHLFEDVLAWLGAGRVSIPVLAMSLAVIAWIIATMTRLTEEDPLYHRGIRSIRRDRRPRSTGEINESWQAAERLGRGFGRPRGPLRVRSGDGLWLGAQRWRSVASPGMTRFALFMCIWIVGWMQLMFSTPLDAKVPFLMFFIVILPSATVGQIWLRQWPFLQGDSLRPVERGVFLKQVGLAMAIDSFQCWALMVGVMLVDVLLFGAPTALTPRLIALAISSLLSIQIFGFAINVWLMRHGATPLFLLPVICLPPLAGLILLPVIPHFDAYRSYGVVTAITLAIAGIVILRDAYRRWLVTELG